jgi:hypothetical protein
MTRVRRHCRIRLPAAAAAVGKCECAKLAPGRTPNNARESL